MKHPRKTRRLAMVPARLPLAVSLTAVSFWVVLSYAALCQQVAASGDEAVQRFAVNVAGNLYGVYLGEGRVLTAAHVVSSAHTIVRIAGRNLEARTIKKGEFEKVDLALLEVDINSLPASLGLRMMPVCVSPLRIGQGVVVATPQSLAHSHIMSPRLLPPALRDRFKTAIPDVATTGNSGSGVFDAEKQCLLGIMSRKIQVVPRPGTLAATGGAARDIGKYFVPANEISAFLGDRDR